MSQRQSLKSSSMKISKFKRIPGRTPIVKTWRTTPVATTRMVKNIVANSTETKFVDNSYSVTPDNTGAITTIILPVIGTGDSNRIGDDIKPTSLVLRGYLSGGNIHVMRVIVFQWHLISTSAPTYNSILNPSFNGTSLSAPFSEPNWDYKKKSFKILSDKTMFSQGTGDITLINYMVSIPASKLRKINFIAGSGTTCINGLYLLTVQDGIVSLNSLSFDARLTYKDS